jgi:hypothetical protein
MPRPAIHGYDVARGLLGFLAAHCEIGWKCKVGRDYKVMMLSGRGICMKIAHPMSRESIYAE